MTSMKNILKISAAALCLIAAASCDGYLDKKPTDIKTEADMFSSFQQTDEQITRLYALAKASDRPLAQMHHYSESPCCDEAECTSTSEANNLTNRWNEGDWEPGSDIWKKTTATGSSSASNTTGWWAGVYSNIRRANKILECIETYNTPDSPSEPGTLMNRVGEVLYIRAYLHYVLLRNYGECVYLDHSIKQSDDRHFTREDVFTIAQKICDDCDEAYSRVPAQNSGLKFARIDKGACLGLKAMVRWIVATPLYNGGIDGNGTFPFTDNRTGKELYAKYDPQRWVDVKKACDEVINFSIEGRPKYNLYQGADKNDCTDKLGNNTSASMVPRRLWELFVPETMEPLKQEWICFWLRDKSAGWWGDNYPPSQSGGGREMPTQDQVDEYEFIGPDGYGYPIYALKENHASLYNGLISESALKSSYDDANPYVNRDPRMYRDVIYHGSTFKSTVINTASGPDKINAANSTTTGYFLRKFCDGSHNKAAGSGAGVLHCPPALRLSTVYLMWAEAVTRTEGPNAEVYKRINEIRSRSFMAPMPPATMSSKDLMLDYIARERRVELYHEKCRFWQCRFYLEPALEAAKDRQWESLPGSTNDAKAQEYFEKYGAYPKTQHRICGMRPVEDAGGKIVINGKKYRMERYWVENRVFESKHYLMPIPVDELQKAGIQQNPDW